MEYYTAIQTKNANKSQKMYAYLKKPEKKICFCFYELLKQATQCIVEKSQNNVSAGRGGIGIEGNNMKELSEVRIICKDLDYMGI